MATTACSRSLATPPPVDHLARGVEQRAAGAVARWSRASRGVRPGVPMTPTTRAMASTAASASVTERGRRKVEAVGQPVELLGGCLSASASADAARPDQGHHAYGGVRRAGRRPPELRLPPDEPDACVGRFVGRPDSVDSGGNPRSDPGMRDLEVRSACSRSSADARRGRAGHLVGQASIVELRDVRGDEHLAPVSRPRRPAALCTSTPTYDSPPIRPSRVQAIRTRMRRRRATACPLERTWHRPRCAVPRTRCGRRE